MNMAKTFPMMSSRTYVFITCTMRGLGNIMEMKLKIIYKKTINVEQV